MLITVQNTVTGETLPPVEIASDDLNCLIGSSEDCWVCVEGDGVEEEHARLFAEDGRLCIEDLGSAGGTLVNGSRIQGTHPFSQVDLAQIADFVIRVENVESLDAGPKQPSPSSSAILRKMRETVEAAKPAPRVDRLSASTKKPDGALPSSAMPQEYQDAIVLYTDDMMMLKNRIHNQILSRLNLSEAPVNQAKKEELREQLVPELDGTLRRLRHELPDHIPVEVIRQAMLDEFLGYGPISTLLKDDNVNEIMINGPELIFVEMNGRLYETGMCFFHERHLQTILKRIVEPIGRHVDEANPMVDARLPDGSRVNAVIPPLALDGSSVTIRKFSKKKLTTDDLIAFGSMTPEIALFLQEAVRARQNILVSGGTGSGKTTLLNVLSQFIPLGERLVTIEDSAELKLDHRNLVRLEARPANIEGQGRISIRDLVVNSLRMRPDRIIVGECRGSEAFDMLQAMNTGHDGSLTTCHANNPRDALSRLENMVMMAGFELPSAAIREQIASAVNIIVQQTRLADGTRKIVNITEITGREGDVVLQQEIFGYTMEGFDENKKIKGHYAPTGNIPRFVEELKAKGDLNLDMSVFVPMV